MSSRRMHGNFLSATLFEQVTGLDTCQHAGRPVTILKRDINVPVFIHR